MSREEILKKLNLSDNMMAHRPMVRIIDLVLKECEEMICYNCKHFYIGNDDYSHCNEGVNDGTDDTNYQVATDDVVEDDFGCNKFNKKDSE